METLYLAFRQAIGSLIDEATSSKNILNVDHFVRITEELLQHGFISNKTLFSKGRTVWDFIEQTLNSPDIITTVISLTEQVPDDRVAVYLETALAQQSIGNHMNCLFSDDSLLEQWYLPSAILRDFDHRTAILGLFQGLNRIEMNIHVRERRYFLLISKSATLSISQLGSLFAKGDQVLKSSIKSTMDTIEKVQHQVVETAQHGVQSIRSVGDRHVEDERIRDLNTTIETLEKQVKEEKTLRMALEVDLISLKMVHEKEMKKLNQEIYRLEQILISNNIDFKIPSE
jgi:hypothetical protein